MPERRGKLGQSLSMVLMLIIMAGIAVGLGVLMGKYAFGLLATGPSADQGRPSDSTEPAGGLSRDAASSSATGPAATAPSGVPSPGPQEPGVTTVGSTGGQAATTPPGPGPTLHRVQVGGFDDRAEAENLARELTQAGYPGFVTSSTPYRVQVGAFAEKANAEKLASELEKKGYAVVVLQ
ncbi:MAG: SPOR domain-containing protein [Bacillota bacterium]